MEAVEEIKADQFKEHTDYQTNAPVTLHLPGATLAGGQPLTLAWWGEEREMVMYSVNMEDVMLTTCLLMSKLIREVGHELLVLPLYFKNIACIK